MEISHTTTATIYCGFKKTISDKVSVYPSSYEDIWMQNRQLIQKYVDEIGLCVTTKETTFIYTGGFEKGIEVGLINYPRFPSTPEEIKDKAIALAQKLMEFNQQQRVSVVMDNYTYMLENQNKDE